MSKDLEAPHTVPAFLAPLAQSHANAVKRLNAVSNPRSDGVVELKTMDNTSRIGLTTGYTAFTMDIVVNGAISQAAVIIQTSN